MKNEKAKAHANHKFFCACGRPATTPLHSRQITVSAGARTHVSFFLTVLWLFKRGMGIHRTTSGASERALVMADS